MSDCSNALHVRHNQYGGRDAPLPQRDAPPTDDQAQINARPIFSLFLDRTKQLRNEIIHKCLAVVVWSWFSVGSLSINRPDKSREHTTTAIEIRRYS